MPAEPGLDAVSRNSLKTYAFSRISVDRADTTDDKLGILKALGEAALDEHAEWILLHRERPLEHGKL